MVRQDNGLAMATTTWTIPDVENTTIVESMVMRLTSHMIIDSLRSFFKATASMLHRW